MTLDDDVFDAVDVAERRKICMKNKTAEEWLEIEDEAIDLGWINQMKVEMHDGLYEDVKKNRKACGLLIPLVPHDDIIELLAELHDLRMEKEMRKIEEDAKKA
jgi:hypothetical protein